MPKSLGDPGPSPIVDTDEPDPSNHREEWRELVVAAWKRVQPFEGRVALTWRPYAGGFWQVTFERDENGVWSTTEAQLDDDGLLALRDA